MLKIPDSVYAPDQKARATRRRAWIGVQLLVTLPFLFALGIATEMLFAQPGKGYRTPSGTYVACEALAPRFKSYSPPSCARFGSMGTNPAGFALAIASLGVLGAVLWVSCGPGRGFRFSR
jgi:hypothetical protein